VHDTDHPTTNSQVLRHVGMTLDGCVGRPEHAVHRMTGSSRRQLQTTSGRRQPC
jgi:hypothetical protein